ncbi:hypothetical protein B0T10DRAFT_456492 [Thelonectria olida]|uniref:Copper-fist domain-containing protein n=1 Tax=Thelonectria olida TaxID=1576542 RepID=A0A9P8W9N3_9HYPO|nr:hypothetical protein B0T10DRAFT_456492 [Thelonectria olida]
MPLINGQKMAWAFSEPCIRGHRSTKCTHADERLMVPVRKPGRPLSICPHPPSRPCPCSQVTAAIPRKQKCRCGTEPAESSKAKNETSNSSEATPQSPSKVTTPSYRVQKTSNKNGASNPSRRQSVDPTAIERMDPNLLNVMPAYSGVQQTPAPIPDMSAFSAMGMIPADTPFGPMVYPMFPPQMPSPMMTPDTTNGMSNGRTTPMANGETREKIEPPIPKVGSCCGGSGGSNSSTTAPPTAQSPTAAASPVGADEPKTKSCCSPEVSSPKEDQKPDALPASDVSTPNGFMMSPFPTPIVMPNGMYGYYPQPTVFTYPPQYGSYLQPLQPDQWRQVMASMTFAAQGAMPLPYGLPPGAIPYQHQNVPPSTSGTSHQCSCGASCQCVGCAAHPYNEATQNYVRSAWESMMDDAQNHPGHTNGPSDHNHVNGHANGHRENGTNGTVARQDSANHKAAPFAGSLDGNASPPAPQTPSDAASGVSEEQALSASDFFFVTYPFGDSCAGDTASCPCGDDCQCIGCVIHSNPNPATEDGGQGS